jgi:V8-like Glu-specific endopeptidase
MVPAILRFVRPFAWLVFAPTLLAACGPKSAKEAPVGERSAPTIYGANDRIDYSAITNPQWRQWADATAVLAVTEEMDCSSGTHCNLVHGAFIPPLCPDEPLAGQPHFGYCSGFLIGPDLLATAGHCARVNGDPALANERVVFGWVNDATGNAPLSVPISNVFRMVEVIAQDHGADGSDDYAVVRLDRPVEGRVPLTPRHQGYVSDGAPLMVFGYPIGEPLKVVTRGSITMDANAFGFFNTNLDIVEGNSGSVVFNPSAGWVEGILVSDNSQDFASLEPAPGGGYCTRESRESDSDGQAGVQRIVRALTYCHDGVRDADETGVDCGGSCAPCNLGHCQDGIRNADETAVDCGGSCGYCAGGERVDLDSAGNVGMARVSLFDPPSGSVSSCSGVLVNNRWVLTNASCISDYAVSHPASAVSVDIVDFARDGESGLDFPYALQQTANLVVRRSVPSGVDDVALVRLPNPVQIRSVGTQWFRHLRSGDRAGLLGQALRFYGYGGDGAAIATPPPPTQWDLVVDGTLRLVDGLSATAHRPPDDARLFDSYGNGRNQLPIDWSSYANYPTSRSDHGGAALVGEELAGLHAASSVYAISCARLYGDCGGSMPPCVYGPVCGRDPNNASFLGSWGFRDWVYQTIASYDADARNWAWALVAPDASIVKGGNSKGAANNAGRISTGNYMVNFEGEFDRFWFEQGGAAHAMAYGGNQRCSVERFGDDGSRTVAWVNCYAPDGSPADATFVVAFQKRLLATGSPLGAYLTAWGDDHNSVGSQWNSTGRPNVVSKSGPGTYNVILTGQGGAPRAGNEQVTMFDFYRQGGSCKLGAPFSPFGNDVIGTVRCYDNAGNIADRGFVLSYGIVSSGGGTSGGYAEALFPFLQSYEPAQQYGYLHDAPIGAHITAGRYATGSYWMNYPSLDATSAVPIVSAVAGSSSYCNVASWGPSADGTLVNVMCFGSNGDPADTKYSATLATNQ